MRGSGHLKSFYVVSLELREVLLVTDLRYLRVDRENRLSVRESTIPQERAVNPWYNATSDLWL